MKKQFRLKRNEEIATVVSKAKRIANDSFVVYYVFNNENENIRICISTSKKLGHAVLRNKIRRQIREMVHSIFDLNLKYDIVIVARQNYLKHEFNENKELLSNTYLKIIHKETI